MRILITGATGLLGRNLLMEYIKCFCENLKSLEVILLVRSLSNDSGKERIKKIILEEEIHYLDSKKISCSELECFIDTNIQCINYCLEAPDLNISAEDRGALNRKSIDVFYHISALTDFRDSEKVKENLWKVNVCGTDNILNMLNYMNVDQFIYVSSAYVCGYSSNNILPNLIDLNKEFRNPYEKSKLEAEIKVIDKMHSINMRYKIFRPSTICGRLIENEIGAINKFDVFYAWAAFFLKIKKETFSLDRDRLYTPVSMSSRIYCNARSGLNIVPADFAAKVMFNTVKENHSDTHYHLVNEEEFLHWKCSSIILDSLNISGYSFVEDMPDNMSKLEKLYYKTVGRIYSPYMASPPMLFDTSNLKEIYLKNGLKCPEINISNMQKLLDYAKQKDFGLRID